MSLRRTFSFLLLAVSALLRSTSAQTAEEQASIVQQIRAGGEAMHRGDAAAAESIFQRVVAAAPTLSDGYLGLGMAQLRRGELDEAAKSLRQATELDPQLPGAHLFLGIADYQIGQSDEAAASLRAELALAPENIEALTWLGIVEIGVGHPEEATAPLDKAAALAPKNAEVLYYCARAHNLVAEATYRKLYQLDPDSVLVHRALAETLAASGQPEKSIAEYQAAIRKDPKNADLYEALGDQDQKISRTDAAIQAYEEELKLNPNSAIALYNLGMIQVKTGKPEAGVPLLRRAEAEHAMAAPTDFYLGFGLAQLGKDQEATHWLELSLANSPSPFIEQSAYYQLARVYQKLGRKTDADNALEELKKLKAEAAKQITGGGDAVQPDAAAPPVAAPTESTSR
ncbi:MAG TPA: tetratricopeptide repeat protein [Acidobacteriaceae bacterium]|jgi:tetratricopeptide (TPR) repeat protein|nr:tetratricopeptide repeat protein [Acidobacteriaceae bacterium]